MSLFTELFRIQILNKAEEENWRSVEDALYASWTDDEVFKLPCVTNYSQSNCTSNCEYYDSQDSNELGRFDFSYTSGNRTFSSLQLH